MRPLARLNTRTRASLDRAAAFSTADGKGGIAAIADRYDQVIYGSFSLKGYRQLL
jgi:hypothetical protein